MNGALSAASGLHMNAVIYYDLIVIYYSFLYISGDLDGPVINNEIPYWSTRAANITLVTKSGRDVIQVADASLRKAMGAYDNIDFENSRLGDIGDSSEIFQTRHTVVGRKYKIKFDVYVEPPTMNTGWWHVSFCKQKDVNGILIIRNTAEDNYTHPEAFEAIMCPQPFLVNEWQKVSGSYTATSRLTTFALHSEGTRTAWFDSIEIVDEQDNDINSRNHPTTGSASITVYGSGFAGADATVKTRSGGTAAEASRWISDTACLSRYPTGVMTQTQHSSMSIQGLLMTLTEAVSLDLPSLRISNTKLQNHRKISDLVITSVGSNFGTYRATSNLRLRFTVVERSTWVSETTLTWCFSFIPLFLS